MLHVASRFFETLPNRNQVDQDVDQVRLFPSPNLLPIAPDQEEDSTGEF